MQRDWGAKYLKTCGREIGGLENQTPLDGQRGHPTLLVLVRVAVHVEERTPAKKSEPPMFG